MSGSIGAYPLPNDLPLEIAQAGEGRPLLFLHGMMGAMSETPFLARLAQHASVIAPSHPGFGGTPLPAWIDSIDDLTYLYLDLLDAMDLGDVILVGSSMGAWIAAEMMVKSARRVSHLVLIGPMGIKIGDRETRDFPDIYALHPDEVGKLVWHDPQWAPDISALSDAALEQLLRQREAAVLYLWEPYLHNPRLRRRLHRITVPTLVLRGEHDGIVSQITTQAYGAAIPDARCGEIAGAGHVPEIEQPDILADRIIDFAGLATPLRRP